MNGDVMVSAIERLPIRLLPVLLSGPDSGLVVCIHLPLTQSCIIWYWVIVGLMVILCGRVGNLEPDTK